MFVANWYLIIFYMHMLASCVSARPPGVGAQYSNPAYGYRSVNMESVVIMHNLSLHASIVGGLFFYIYLHIGLCCFINVFKTQKQ